MAMSRVQSGSIISRRILVPINADAESRWGVLYAIRQRQAGDSVEVVLLNIGEAITQWQVLRFRTQNEIALFQAQRAEMFFAEEEDCLAQENIPHRSVFRQGDVVFSILDVAEVLECTEIVLPKPATGIAGLFSRAIATNVLKHRQGIPVVLVDASGLPAKC